MSREFISSLRNSVAVLITLSGLAHVAALWLRELNGAALVDALFGAVYLFIGIGLFGQSRFTLFMAMLVPAAQSYMLLHAATGLSILQLALIALNGLFFLCCAVLLWLLRHEPSA